MKSGYGIKGLGGIAIKLVLRAVTVLAMCKHMAVASEPSAGRFARSFSSDVQRLSFTGDRSILRTIRFDGTRSFAAETKDLKSLRNLRSVVLIVHGTQYDPRRAGLLNPHATFAHVIRSHLDSTLYGVSFGWFSVPFSIKNQLLSFGSLTPTIYGLARKRLDEETIPLSKLIGALPPQWSAICHSLGCELLQLTLETHPALPKPRRILLLSGDLREDAFDHLALAAKISVLAVRSEADFPLARSAFRRESKPFWSGKKLRRSKWVDMVFDPEELGKGRRFSFSYSNRRRFWDHMAAFEFDEPWQVYNDFLTGGLPLRSNIPQLRSVQPATTRNED